MNTAAAVKRTITDIIKTFCALDISFKDHPADSLWLFRPFLRRLAASPATNFSVFLAAASTLLAASSFLFALNSLRLSLILILSLTVSVDPTKKLANEAKAWFIMDDAARPGLPEITPSASIGDQSSLLSLGQVS